MRHLARFVLLAAVTSMIAGCSAAERRSDDSSPGVKRSGGTLRFAIGSSPVTLDPAEMVQQYDFVTARPLFAGLTRLTPDGDVELDLARSITTSRNGRTVTIKLRPGLEWSDGTALTAADVVRSWRDIFDFDLGGGPGASAAIDMFEGAQDIVQTGAEPSSLGVDARGTTTVVVKLTRPIPYFDQLLAQPAFWPLPPAAHESKHWWRGQPLVSSGPFTLASPVPDGEIVQVRMERNRHYWNAARVDLDAIELTTLRDPQAALGRVVAGKLDGASAIPDAASIERLRGTEGLSLEPGTSTVSLVLRPVRRPMNDPHVREGISRALDRSTIADASDSGAQPTIRLVAPGLAHADQIRRAPGSPDPAAMFDTKGARALFRQARIKPSDTFVILATYPHRAAVEQAIAESVERAGLAADVRLPESPDDFVRIVSEGTDDAYDAYLTQTVSNYPDANSMFAPWRCSQQLCDERVDRALERANEATDVSDRVRRLGEVESLLTGPGSGHLVLPLYHPGDFLIYTDRIGGARVGELSYLYLDRLTLK